MGLLEKALRYKNEINSKGKKTLIDRIEGPADTDLIKNPSEIISGKDEIYKLDENELHEVKESVNGKAVVDELSTDEIEKSLSQEYDFAEVDSTMSKEIVDDFISTENGMAKESENENKIKNSMDENADNFVNDLSYKDLPDIDLSDFLEKNIDTEDNAGIVVNAQSAEGKSPKNYGNDYSEETDDVYSDLMILCEIQKEIFLSETREQLFDVILFSLMGHLGSTSSSIMISDPEKSNWKIAESRGISIDSSDLNFEINRGILKELSIQKVIVDIDDFKDNRDFTDDYSKYISVDTRLLVPCISNDGITAIIILGDKLTADEYNDREKLFLSIIAEISSIAMHNIELKKEKNEQRLRLQNEFKTITDVDRFHERLIDKWSMDQVNSIIQEEFKLTGVESYAVFIGDDRGSYVPVSVEKEDSIMLWESDFKININSDFIKYINRMSAPVEIEKISTSNEISEIFSGSQISRMKLFRAYPFKIGNNLSGFITIFRVNESVNMGLLDQIMTRINKFLINAIMGIAKFDYKENIYIDNVESFLQRIESELKRASDLGIPLTLVLFSIKNYKRYYNLYGYDDLKKLFLKFEKVIKHRLSDGDFSVRYDRQKILLILPGKDKKFAVPMANSIRNEIIHEFRKKEMQLLVPFLTAEFPEDGIDLFSLIDSID